MSIRWLHFSTPRKRRRNKTTHTHTHITPDRGCMAPVPPKTRTSAEALAHEQRKSKCQQGRLRSTRSPQSTPASSSAHHCDLKSPQVLKLWEHSTQAIHALQLRIVFAASRNSGLHVLQVLIQTEWGMPGWQLTTLQALVVFRLQTKQRVSGRPASVDHGGLSGTTWASLFGKRNSFPHALAISPQAQLSPSSWWFPIPNQNLPFGRDAPRLANEKRK